ncbi:MAG TPA: hypothetical protein VJ577_07525 [Burkholderiaceae bacterium]|nr:hypothetical protein [Burkholderiaceae bacterium]
MPDLAQDQIAHADLRKAAYHEAGHKIIYELFGGAGDAFVWKNESGNPDEVAWLGQFRPRTCAEQQHEIWARDGLDVPPLPSNWRAMYGMAGAIAEQILRGETEVEFIAGNLYLRICCDEISATDLASIGVTDIDDFEVDIESVEQCINYFFEHWLQVTQEAEYLIANASTETCAAANV